MIFRFFDGCMQRLFNVASKRLPGQWRARYDEHGNVYALIKERSNG